MERIQRATMIEIIAFIIAIIVAIILSVRHRPIEKLNAKAAAKAPTAAKVAKPKRGRFKVSFSDKVAVREFGGAAEKEYTTKLSNSAETN